MLLNNDAKKQQQKQRKKKTLQLYLPLGKQTYLTGALIIRDTDWPKAAWSDRSGRGMKLCL